MSMIMIGHVLMSLNISVYFEMSESDRIVQYMYLKQAYFHMNYVM